MCGNQSSKAQRHSQELAEKQFQWQKDQAAKAAADAKRKQVQLEHGLVKINKRFGQFDGKYFDGIADQYRDYANPQISKSMAESGFNLRSSLANHGKLGSSTDARQSADLADTFAGIYRDSELKAQEYADSQRETVNNAKNAAISQMYASQSPEAGLVSARGAVRSLNQGAAYEPITALLAQASKFATLDYNNSVYSGRSNGLFSPLFSGQSSQQAPNPATSGSGVKTYTGN